jgi:hypothetical protein
VNFSFCTHTVFFQLPAVYYLHKKSHMKTLTLLIVLLSFAFHCNAQYRDDKELYMQKVEKYRRMKTTGQGLTFGGSVMMVVGIAMLSNVETTTNAYGQTTSTGNVGGGVAVYLLGVGALGAGIPLWIVGGINKGRYERKVQAVSVRLNMTPQSNGFAIRYKF